MKAIRVEQFGGPEVLKLAEVATPGPGTGEVLVRVKAVGVNPVETYIRAGTYPTKPALPFTPGGDCAGVVEKVGPGVSKFKAGDRVYSGGSTISGSYAEFVLCKETQVYLLPSQASFAQGAALGVPYATAYRALVQRGGAVAGETILVHGASGGVGTAAVQWARALGMRVFGTAGTEQGRKQVREQGAHQVFDHTAAGYLEEISKASEGHGVDVILEMAAHHNLGKDLALLGNRGRVVVIGSRGPVEVNARETMGRDADIRGMVLFNASPAEMTSIHQAIHAGLENGSLKPLIGRELPLAEAGRGHEEVMKPGASGKIVLIP